MAEPRNYLLGYGERLNADVDIGSSGGPKEQPYSFDEAHDYLAPMLTKAAEDLMSLPEAACPEGQAVASFTLHPEYYAKSYFPSAVLNRAGLRTVGSRARMVKPKKRSRGRKPEEMVTTELFVAGARSSFGLLASELPTWASTKTEAKQLIGIEEILALSPSERLRPLPESEEALPLEVVLHASGSVRDRFILAGFREFLSGMGIEPDLNRIFFAGKLCFLRTRASKLQAGEMAKFSFLRVLREMPRLRTTTPIIRGNFPRSRPIELPKGAAVDQKLRVALFDGGLPKTSPLTAWAQPLDVPGVGATDNDLLWHGETVTSALLFGSVSEGDPEPPFCQVDHYRVLDSKSANDPFELYEVLERIKTVLDSQNYEFASLSIGPTLPVDDEDVHAWTAVLDEHLSEGRCLKTIAAGNTGEEPQDPVLQKWRVQVPSDWVNGLTVGATDRRTGEWNRARYSSRGPGRSPGIVKPDVVTFGGSEKDPFWVCDPNSPGRIIATAGTSYAAPATLRSAVAVRAHFGQVLSPLAIKALLVHSTDDGGHSREEVGWGRLPNNLDDLVVCAEGCVRVVYQDTIFAASPRRIPIPMPHGRLTGKVNITATFCFATPVDPEHSGNYTKSGLSVVFRPNKTKFSRTDAIHADTAAFFRPKELYPIEQSLRGDAHKWETCLHRRVGKFASSLNEPVFDIHYNARAEGHSDSGADKIRYALVLTIEAPGVGDLYDRVVRTYPTKLQPLNPVIEVPVRTHVS